MMNLFVDYSTSSGNKYQNRPANPELNRLRSDQPSAVHEPPPTNAERDEESTSVDEVCTAKSQAISVGEFSEFSTVERLSPKIVEKELPPASRQSAVAKVRGASYHGSSELTYSDRLNQHPSHRSVKKSREEDCVSELPPSHIQFVVSKVRGTRHDASPRLTYLDGLDQHRSHRSGIKIKEEESVSRLPPNLIQSGVSKARDVRHHAAFESHQHQSHDSPKEEKIVCKSPRTDSDSLNKSETLQKQQALMELMESNEQIETNVHLASALEKLSDTSKTALLLLCNICFLLIIPGSEISIKERAAISLHHGGGAVRKLFGFEHGDYENESVPCRCAVKDKSFSHFLAALHILTSPVMFSMKFTLEVMPKAGAEGWKVLKFVFGLAGSGFIKTNKGLLTTLLNCLGTLYLPEGQPLIKKSEFLYMLACLQESGDLNLFRQLLHEFVSAQTIILSIKDVEDNAQSLATFVSNTLPVDQYWIIYGFGGVSAIPNFNEEMKRIKGIIIVKELEGLGITKQSDVLIITTRNLDYLKDTVSPMLQLQVFSIDTSQTQQYSLESSVYGHLSREQYEIVRKLVTAGHFNIVKDSISPHLTMHSIQPVQAQYRKNDHVWFRLSRNLRDDWYKSVKISPCVPIHWVKVPQPNGIEDLEVQCRRQASAQLVSRANETAELVLLNSQPLNLMEIATPTFNESIAIVFQNQDEAEDQGFIGCDFLADKYLVYNVSSFECKPFDIKRDMQIGRLLPLPSRKVEMGQSTTLTNTPEGQGDALQGQSLPSQRMSSRHVLKPQLPSVTLGSIFPIQTKPYIEAAAEIEEAALISEHQIKKEAMNGFDLPGYCFYGDQVLFQVGKEYPLPDTLSTCHMLREGGNGIVLEVKFSGELYAVKKTAFRWREVLIMPKLRHKNILKLVALMIGKPLESHSRRRYVYQLYPKLTNDLGRSVGSFEKHCLRTLMERYQGEPLLLKKIKSNFCHVAREILAALHYLHSRPMPVVHRDVKASNILVKMACNCHNPLICVCRKQPDIVLSDFDASLELSKDGNLEPDPPRASNSSFQSFPRKVYHVSAVGTVGYKSPEGSIYMIGNNLETMPPLSTKADIFGYGVLMALLFLNEEGPKHQQQMSQLLLSVNQTVGPNRRLSQRQKEILSKNKIHLFRPTEIAVSQQDIDKVLPIGRARREFTEHPVIISFLESALAADPKHRCTAKELLNHSYLAQ